MINLFNKLSIVLMRSFDRFIWNQFKKHVKKTYAALFLLLILPPIIKFLIP